MSEDDVPLLAGRLSALALGLLQSMRRGSLLRLVVVEGSGPRLVAEEVGLVEGVRSALDRDFRGWSEVTASKGTCLELPELGPAFQTPAVLMALREAAAGVPGVAFRVELPQGFRDVMRARAGLPSGGGDVPAAGDPAAGDET
jgi:hypothetical protein